MKGVPAIGVHLDLLQSDKFRGPHLSLEQGMIFPLVTTSGEREGLVKGEGRFTGATARLGLPHPGDYSCECTELPEN